MQSAGKDRGSLRGRQTHHRCIGFQILNSHKGRHMIDFGLGKLRLWSAAAACAGLFMTQAAGAHPADYTLNDVMQAPFASDMMAAPTGTAVAWVFNAKGCSNIWVADPSHGAKARQITPYTEDDGFAIGELAWSPDAKSIAFTRGQSLVDDTPANVNTSPEGTMPREVWE